MTTQQMLNKVPENIRQDFLTKLKLVCSNIGCTVEELLCIIHLETAGTMSPNIVNHIGAVGLIQFTQSTLKWLKYDYNVVKNMNHVQQLDVVQKFFKQFKKPKNFVDLYLTVFYPAAVGRSSGFVLGSTPAIQKEIAKNNPVFAKNGKITIGDVEGYLKRVYPLEGLRYKGSNFAAVIVLLISVFFFANVS